ncbi:MAG: hypothetical protein A3D92_02205 [Bacteroidetes bacterium RIFCSPHIGHO2_02_FULL_44_7]|nr:MAG: hypothetical protein A3D92_02205 [Bacteroidetes bacterium RIFCSPHIGHO2_02_FULL_44_7]
MRILIVLLLIASTHISCSAESKPLPELSGVLPDPPDSLGIDSLSIGLNFRPNGSYESTKTSIRKRMQAGQNSGADLENYLLNEIIPFWYGTPWDFNGYTAIPNQGEIACGYFVSTTLQHAGININRYHLAQQGGLNEAKSLAITDEHYETIYGIDQLAKVLKERYVDGLYFVGLDNHVGFLYIKHGTPYFLHSNYIENRVMIEKALTAPAFQSTIYVIADITTNELLLEKWRTGAVVNVVRN